jgi:ribosomal protein S18 acetylase RimI-like enzyme
MALSLKEDNWLSGRLEKQAFRLDVPAGGILAAELRPTLASINAPCFVYCKVPAAQMRTAHALEGNGFRLVDTLLTLERPMSPPVPGNGNARLSEPEDRLSVTQVARESFSFSRFHADPKIEREVANQIKADWAGNFFSGQRGDAMIVAEAQHRIVGFLQLLIPAQTLIIDLIAVHPSHRRQGYAAAMIACAQRHFSNLAAIRVGTQAANIPAVRMYERLGFRLMAAHYVLHYHGPEQTAG